MNIVKIVALCSVLLIQQGTLRAQTARSLYIIYDTKEKKEITLQELVASLAPVDILFFGEEHNDSVAHVLQLELLKELNKRYDHVALSMEMFVSDDQ